MNSIFIDVASETMENDDVLNHVNKIILPSGTELNKNGDNFDFSPLKEFIDSHISIQYDTGESEVVVLLEISEIDGFQCIYFENVDVYYEKSVLDS